MLRSCMDATSENACFSRLANILSDILADSRKSSRSEQFLAESRMCVGRGARLVNDVSDLM